MIKGERAMLIEKVNNGSYSQCRIPGIVMTENGSLLAYYECRKSNSDWAEIDIKIIRSTDGGESWQTVTVIENGRIYHVNCESSAARENLTVKISDDLFKTFESIFVDTPAGYSDIAVKNNTLYVLYERDCNNGGLYFKKINL